ncbi:MAG TPA: magnesium-translocating P-type ATPase [Candidatus Dormibacteraeota bacterium]|nr:magnesium-translocating P-type ATPase [Candidatus Dormibacteraeota bacterium]
MSVVPVKAGEPTLTLLEAAGLTAGEALSRLGSSVEGLSPAEAAHRLAVVGPNAVRSHDVRALSILGRQLRNPLLILLGAATLIAFLTGEHTDAIIILAIVGLSVGLGFFNEYRSERVIEALHASIRHRSLVMRGGQSIAVDVTELVPGDVVLLRPGDLVPADLRLIDSRELECDQAILTGEPMPKSKGSEPESDLSVGELGLRCAAYMGTTVRGGSGSGVVVLSGSATAFGKIALRLGERQPETAFQRGLRSFSVLLVWVTGFLAGGIFIANSLLGRPILESALFSLAIAVGLTPQLLPAIVSVSLASGARNLARKRVVVKRLISIEDLGNIEVLFTDKTGTLTEGRITFQKAIDPGGEPDGDVLKLGLLCAAGEGVDPAGSGNTLDAALLEAGVAPPGYRHLDNLPFDHVRRMMSALVAAPDGSMTLITKGAPESIFERCRPAAASAQSTVEQQFSAGARVVAVATKPWTGAPHCTLADERDLELKGFLTFLDAPKADAAESLDQLKRLGVEVKIVTGDNPVVAQTVCRQLGLDHGESITGPELDQLSDQQLLERLPRVGIFARVSPDQKSRIITAQRSLGRDVGFLGDGVNDAVALRDADVGISVDTGSEVAKDAADIVLLGKDLGILARGVLEGRRIFSNTMKYVLMGTSSNFGNMFSAAGGSLLLNFLPMTPTQILLNNLIYDAGEMTIPTDKVDAELLERPAQWDIRMIRRFMIFFGPISSLFDFATFGVMLFIFHARGSLFQTAWFTESLATQSLVIFAIRTRRVPFFRSRPGLALTAGTLGSVVVAVGLPFTPLASLFGFKALPGGFLAILGLMVVIYLTLVEVGKNLFFKHLPVRPRLPVERWELTPTLQTVEKFASRWTVGSRSGRRSRSTRKPEITTP